MSDEPQYKTAQDYARVLRRNRWLVLVIVGVFGAVAFGYSSSQTPVYQASAQLAISDPSQDAITLGDSAFPLLTQEQLAARAATLVSTPEVATVVARKLKLKVKLSKLQARASGVAQQLTNLVLVQAKDSDPKSAAVLANSFALAVRDIQTEETRARYRRAIKIAKRSAADIKPSGSGPIDKQSRLLLQQLTLARLNNLTSLSEFSTPVKVVRSAEIPENPVSPHPVRDTFLGLLIGFTLATIIAFMRDALDRRLKTATEIRDELQLPLIGHIRDEIMGRSVVASNGLTALDGQELEAFRMIRNNVDHLDVDAPARTLIVTSGLPGEGKSTVASGLAFAHAVAGRRVLLVECDLRRPVLAKRLGLAQSPGLTDFLVGHAQPADILQVVALPGASTNGDGEAGDALGLVVVTAGSPTSNPAELLASDRFKEFLGSVRDAYEFVVIDSTPLLSVVDALELIPQVDGVVLCARSIQTTRDQLRSVRGALDRMPTRPTGVVVTGLKPADDEGYGYYSYAYAYGSKS